MAENQCRLKARLGSQAVLPKVKTPLQDSTLERPGPPLAPNPGHLPDLRCHPPCHHLPPLPIQSHLSSLSLSHLTSIFNEGVFIIVLFVFFVLLFIWGFWLCCRFWLFICLFWDEVSLCSPIWLGTGYVHQAGLELNEFLPTLSLEYWD